MKNDRFLRNSILALIVALTAQGCNPVIQPKLSPGELVRLQIETGADESILFSTAILFDQTGTDQFNRTVERSVRLYTDKVGTLGNGFYTESNEPELQSPRDAFEARIVDSLWGKITYKIGSNHVTRSYGPLLYRGKARLLKIGSWRLWRLEHRGGFRPSGDGSPDPQSIVVQSDNVSQEVTTSNLFRARWDSLITLTTGATSSLTVTVITDTPDDTFFVTYPVAGGYQTTVMSHDSVRHVATVAVSSLRRFELLAIQGFKSEAFKNPLYQDSLATTIQTAMIAFR